MSGLWFFTSFFAVSMWTILLGAAALVSWRVQVPVWYCNICLKGENLSYTSQTRISKYQQCRCQERALPHHQRLGESFKYSTKNTLKNHLWSWTIFSLSSCFVYFMLWCPLVVKTASAGFSPIGGQPPKWPPSAHSKSKYSENTPIHYIRLF
jgi:hypothetical protein